MENINNPNLKVTTFKELGFRNRWMKNRELRNRHFHEVDEDILDDLNSDFSKNINEQSLPGRKRFNNTPDKHHSKYDPKSNHRENTIKFGNKLPAIKIVNPISSRVSNFNKSKERFRSRHKHKDEPFIILDYHKPIQFTGNPFNKADLYYNPFKKDGPKPEPLSVTQRKI